VSTPSQSTSTPTTEAGLNALVEAELPRIIQNIEAGQADAAAGSTTSLDDLLAERSETEPTA
jgi:hypothetical protein